MAKRQSYTKSGTRKTRSSSKVKSKGDEYVAEKSGLISGHCNMPAMPRRELPPDLPPMRERLIRLHDRKWANHTVLHYHFLDQPSIWRGSEDDKDAVRRAFQEWKDVPIGLDFVEVFDANEAEIRIGFFHSQTAPDGGSWSVIGRDAVDLVTDPAHRTMNFGWALTDSYGYDTALHEIGHALGFPHEHQNPKAGIVWDTEAVYDYYTGFPNFWTREETDWNVLRKLSLAEVDGSDWDPNSIMHYWVRPGLILEPPEFHDTGLFPESGLSESDIATVKQFYPAAEDSHLPVLRPFESHQVRLEPGGQLDFVIRPEYSRTYRIQTFGGLDTVLVLFEEIDGEPRFMAGDDDSGWQYNAKISQRLVQGRTYYARLRLYFAQSSGEGAIMMY